MNKCVFCGCTELNPCLDRYDGKPHQFENDLDGKTIAVYPTKRQAARYYQDVRKGKLIVPASSGGKSDNATT